MGGEKRHLERTNSEILKDATIDQQIVIMPDGKVEIPWINPNATQLVLEVYQAVSGEPFPVKVISGNLYCG